MRLGSGWDPAGIRQSGTAAAMRQCSRGHSAGEAAAWRAGVQRRGGHVEPPALTCSQAKLAFVGAWLHPSRVRASPATKIPMDDGGTPVPNWIPAGASSWEHLPLHCFVGEIQKS